MYDTICTKHTCVSHVCIMHYCIPISTLQLWSSLLPRTLRMIDTPLYQLDEEPETTRPSAGEGLTIESYGVKYRIPASLHWTGPDALGHSWGNIEIACDSVNALYHETGYNWSTLLPTLLFFSLLSLTLLISPTPKTPLGPINASSFHSENYLPRIIPMIYTISHKWSRPTIISGNKANAKGRRRRERKGQRARLQDTQRW